MFSAEGHATSSCQQQCTEDFQPQLLTRLGGSHCSRVVGVLWHVFSTAKMHCCCSRTDATLQSVKAVLKLRTASVGWDPPRMSGDRLVVSSIAALGLGDKFCQRPVLDICVSSAAVTWWIQNDAM